MQNEIAECLSNPCENDGYCDDRFLGYECFCRNGFTGNVTDSLVTVHQLQ